MSGVLVAAPYPVVIPHPRRQALSRGAFSSTATTEYLETTVYCEKVEVPICLLAQASTLDTYEVVKLLALALETRCAVRHNALALGGTNSSAEVGLAALAELAFTALSGVKGDDMVANLDVVDVGADRLDDTTSLVTEDNGEGTLGVLAGEGIVVTVKSVHAQYPQLYCYSVIGFLLCTSDRQSWKKLASFGLDGGGRLVEMCGEAGLRNTYVWQTPVLLVSSSVQRLR